MELKSGTAEIFGTEMVLNTKYKFKQGAKIAVYSFHGCQVFVSGQLEVQPYTRSFSERPLFYDLPSPETS